jgi:hypothetical protein
MKWVTRERAKVDRIACPWLIKKFIDPDAEFLFVPANKVLSTAESTKAIPFDIEGVELGHHGDKCTFDALIEKYNLKDRVLFGLAKIVRGADTNAKDLTPYSNGLEAIAEGFRSISRNDFENMQRQFPVYDALYAFCKMQLG